MASELQEFARMPVCEWALWMPMGSESTCDQESVRRVDSTTCEGIRRKFRLCRDHADFVVAYDAGEKLGRSGWPRGMRA